MLDDTIHKELIVVRLQTIIDELNYLMNDIKRNEITEGETVCYIKSK